MISLTISLKFVIKIRINTIPALFQIMFPFELNNPYLDIQILQDTRILFYSVL